MGDPSWPSHAHPIILRAVSSVHSALCSATEDIVSWDLARGKPAPLSCYHTIVQALVPMDLRGVVGDLPSS